VSVSDVTGKSVDELYQEALAIRLDEVPSLALLWHGVLPEWTPKLAEDLGEPSAGATLPALVKTLESTELVNSRRVVEKDGRPAEAFWLPSSMRPQVGMYLQGRLTPGTLAEGVRALYLRLRPVVERLPKSASALCELLECQATDATGDHVLDRIEHLLEDNRLHRATDLATAAGALADLVGGRLDTIASQARWRVDRARREAYDSRSLGDYQPRAVLEDALVDLLSHDQQPWALHLNGAGGVGKTVAIRYLSSGLLMRSRGLPPVAVARVDFDHLDPRYPEDRPGELLVAFTAELSGYGSGVRSEPLRRGVLDAAIALHERVAHPDATSWDAELAAVVRAFADYLDSLSRPVVLVLDTCEELVRLTPSGLLSRAAAATLDLLERVHRLVDVRVVLAGRRLLADRPWMRQLQVGGFTDEEAAAYLDRRDPGGAIRPDQRRALLQRCAMLGEGINPFELAGYAGMLLDNPAIAATTLLDESRDLYLEERILGRINDPGARVALGPAVELGRFTLPMIAPELRRHGVDPEAAFDHLAAKEWVLSELTDETGRPVLVHLEPNLLPRLRAALATSSAFRVERARLGRDLADLTLTEPLERLPAEAVEAAVRLLPTVEAAAWWQRLENRICAQGAWAWAAQVVPRAEAGEAARAAASAGSQPTVLAAIRATLAAARLRLRDGEGAMRAWNGVLDSVDRHPEPMTVRALLRRAHLGRWACGAPDHSQLLAGLAEDPNVPADALVAAVEGQVRLSMLGGSPITARLHRALHLLSMRLHQDADPWPAVAVDCAIAELHLRDGQLNDAVTRLDMALRQIATTGSGQTGRGGCYVDWVVTTNLRDRARWLRTVTAAALGCPPAAEGPAWIMAALGTGMDDEHARALVAAALDCRLDWAPVPVEEVEAIAAAAEEIAGTGGLPSGADRISSRSLLAVLVRGFLAAGDEQRAVSHVRRQLSRAVADGDDVPTAMECEAQLALLSRATRTPLTSGLGRMAGGKHPTARVQASIARLLHDGVRPDGPAAVGGDEWLYFQLTGQVADLAGVEGRGGRERAVPAAVDRIESRSGSADLTPLIDVLAGLGGTTPGHALRSLLVEPSDRVLGACLRAAALAVPGVVAATPGGGPWLGHVGLVLERASAVLLDPAPWPQVPRRRIAEIALAEGELLAVRRPWAGVMVLELAQTLFTAVGDSTGAAQSGVLAVLARGRAFRAGMPWRPPVPLTTPSGTITWPGWQTHVHQAQALLARNGDAPWPGVSSAPELTVEAAHPIPQPSLTTPRGAGRTSRTPRMTGVARHARSGRARHSAGDVALSFLDVVLQQLAHGGRFVAGALQLFDAWIRAQHSLGRLTRALLGVAVAGLVGCLQWLAVPGPASGITGPLPRWSAVLLAVVAVAGVLLMDGVRRRAARPREGSPLALQVHATVLLQPARHGRRRIRSCRMLVSPRGMSLLPEPWPWRRFARRPALASRTGYVLLPVVPDDPQGPPGSLLDPDVARSFPRAAGGGQDVLPIRMIGRSCPVPSRLDWRIRPESAAGTPDWHLGAPELLPLMPTVPGLAATAAKIGWNLLHVVGDGLATPAGPRIRVRTGRDRHPRSVGPIPTTGRVQAGERLIAVDDLPCSSVDLLILQAEPGAWDGRRRRLRTGPLMQFAIEATAAGAGLVAVVPPVPDGLARMITWRIAQAVHTPRAGGGDLFDLLHRISAVVAMDAVQQPVRRLTPAAERIAVLAAAQSGG
jgi:hypothetical protein